MVLAFLELAQVGFFFDADAKNDAFCVPLTEW
jgi:hypothetical protein